MHRACQQVTGNEVSTSTLYVILIRWIFGTTCLYHNSQESSTFPRVSFSISHCLLFLTSKSSCSMIFETSCISSWILTCTCIIIHVIFLDFSVHCGKWPRKELILKQSSGPSTEQQDPPPSSPQLYVNPLTGISIKAFLLCAVQFLLILLGHQTAFKLLVMWNCLNVVCGYLATVNKLCTFYSWPHHYGVYVLCIVETSEKKWSCCTLE